jgi:hypothetical protein
MSKAKPTRKFIKERRRNACPACLDRDALTITGQKKFETTKYGDCQICDGKGYVYEVYPVGNEWRRYPWVIVG